MNRLWIGLIIALIGFLMYMFQTQENPVTHKRQHVKISPDQEIRLGLQAAPMMSQKMGGEVNRNDPRSIEVSRIGQFLVSHTEAKGSPWKFRFHLLADPKTINAFALPGGQIFITLGLYNKLQNEAQLAGVLGHEMGHVIERHTAEQMAKSNLGQMLIMAVGASTQNPQGTNYSPMLLASVVNNMFQLHYSRQDESEADIWGVKFMEEAGYNPKAMIQVLEILKGAGGSGRTPEIFQTHPNPDLRIQQIEAYFKEHPPKANLSMGNSLGQHKNPIQPH